MAYSQIKQLTILAEKISADALSYEQIFDELNRYNATPKEIGDIIHFLYHFACDSDIRQKDKEYDVSQRQRLDDVILYLKNYE